MHALFCTFFPFRQCKNYWNRLRFESCSHMYTATFYEPQQKCSFWFLQVRCAHKWGDVINFIIVTCRVSSRLKWYKNYKNWLRLAKVIVKNKMSRFLWFTVYLLQRNILLFNCNEVILPIIFFLLLHHYFLVLASLKLTWFSRWTHKYSLRLDLILYMLWRRPAFIGIIS